MAKHIIQETFEQNVSAAHASIAEALEAKAAAALREYVLQQEETLEESLLGGINRRIDTSISKAMGTVDRVADKVMPGVARKVDKVADRVMPEFDKLVDRIGTRLTQKRR